MPIKLANNASGQIATGLAPYDIGLALVAGQGATFPSLAAGEYFYATLASAGGSIEIVKVTAKVNDTFTIVRAQEGTTALSFSAGARFELRVTAQSVRDAIDDVTASAVTFTPYTSIASTNVQSAIQEVVDEINLLSTNTFTVEVITATEAQTVFNLSNPYVVGATNLSVYMNGLRLRNVVDYVETNSTRVTLTTGAQVGDELTFVAGREVNDAIGASSVSFVPAGTSAVARTAQDKMREVVSVKDFGAVGDGVTDDTAAIQAAIDSGAKNIVFSDGGTYKITNTITFPPNVNVDFGNAQILYAGTRDRPAIVHGAAGQTNNAVVRNLFVVSDTIDWGNTNFVGFRAINMSRASVHVRMIRKFTIGYECFSKGQGYVHTTHNIIAVVSCKYGHVLTCDGNNGASPGINGDYVNENVFIGGDITNFSDANLLGNSYGIWCRAINNGYTGNNANRWYSPCFQPGDGQLGDERIPAFFDKCGGSNSILNARYESGRGPAMRCDGDVGNGVSSSVTVIKNIFVADVVAGAHIQLRVEEKTAARLNLFSYTNQPQFTEDTVAFRDLPRLFKSYSSTSTSISGGLHLTTGAAIPALAQTDSGGSLIRVLRDSVYMFSTRYVGFFIETAGSESFSFYIDETSNSASRPLIRVYDANWNVLNASSLTFPDIVAGYSTTYNYWNASMAAGAGAYYLTANAPNFEFTVSSAVRYIQLLATPGSTGMRIKGLHVKRLSYSQRPIIAFSGLGKPPSTYLHETNPAVHYAAALPSTGIQGSYSRGDIAVNDAAASGGVSYFQCTTAGRLAPAWQTSTAYAVGDLVKNDTTRIYECVTAGTSASSGGPTGTGTAIADGTAVWNYVSPVAVFSNGPNNP